MARPLAFRPPGRRSPGFNLERLEPRQLLSTLAAGSAPVVPPIQPAISAGDFTLLPAQGGGGTPIEVYTPDQIRVAYGVNQITDEGKGETIAIVDAYEQPDIAKDINTFSTLFGLPLMDGKNGDPTLSILVPTGQSQPGYNYDWGVEISLDVEWAHSIAPYANIDLITCQNDSGDSLFAAEVDGEPYSSGVVYAASLSGVVVVSNSWGGSEFNGETDYDSELTTNPNVAMAFATGDSGAPGEYPAYSPDAIAVGGTSLATLSLKGTYGYESGWSDSGGGISQYEAQPSYQSNAGLDYSARTIPDVSMDANPDTGVWVLDTPAGGYGAVGGTSLATPMWAGVIALGDEARAAGGAGSLNSTGILDALYGAYDSTSYSTDFHDITTGNNGYAAGVGYDLVTGIGSPKVPAIVSLIGSFTPAVVADSASHVSLAGSGGGSTGSGAGVDARDRSSIPVYAPQGATLNNSSLLVGSLTDLVTTMDIAKPKKIGS